MRIGIDISQIVYEGTGVARYVKKLTQALLTMDKTNEYILFGASFRRRKVYDTYFVSIKKLNSRARLVTVPLAPTLVDFLWNTLHIIPIEWFVGEIDVFWSSDWTQPPLARAKGITTIHDLAIIKAQETFSQKIIDVQKRRLAQAKKECSIFLCDSQATKSDCMKLLNIAEDKIRVVYPGYP